MGDPSLKVFGSKKAAPEVRYPAAQGSARPSASVSSGRPDALDQAAARRQRLATLDGHGSVVHSNVDDCHVDRRFAGELVAVAARWRHDRALASRLRSTTGPRGRDVTGVAPTPRNVAVVSIARSVAMAAKNARFIECPVVSENRPNLLSDSYARAHKGDAVSSTKCVTWHGGRWH